ncbi:MAG TPA: phosphoglucosamine mutase [Phycisphaerae bacterium]|nr:phosphoglucosamine mutase [Phycisphaerae bacterium]
MDRLIVSVSGVRGTIGGTLSPQAACEFGCAFATMLRSGGDRPLTIAMGRDTRPSGPMLAHALKAGLTAGGVSVVDLGVVSTPGVALMTSKLKAAGGIVITASHNPAEYNGIKFLQPTGTGLTAADAGRLRDIWESRRFALAGPDELGGESSELRTHGLHVDAVCAATDVTAVAAQRFKVVVDSINGAGCVVTPMLLGRLGCEVAQINGEPTGRFAHAPEPIEGNLGQLCQAVRKHRAGVGFAQDPDADRLVIVDEAGRFIGEEYTLALATAFVLSHRKGKVATNLATSRMIDDVAAAAGCEVVRAPTGEANVAEAMSREGCIFGGEGNGGVIDPRVVPVRDSLVGMAMVLQYMAETGKPLSELVRQIPAYVMIKTKRPCPAEAVAPIVARAREASAGRPGAKLDDADGLRVDLPEGWVSVRGSNTEPIIRIMGEAKDRAAVEELIGQVNAIADEVIGKRNTG